MLYKKFSPHPELSHYIECYYLWQTTQTPLPLIQVESPPSGFSAWVFNLGDPYLVGTHQSEAENTPPTFFTGQSTKSYVLHISGHIDMFGIVFKPTALNALFDLPMRDLCDQRIDAELIGGENLNRLRDRLGEVQSGEERADLMNAFFLQKLEEYEPGWDEVDHAVEIIMAKHGMVSLTHLYENYAISKRQFQRNFQKKVGLSPKRYTRLNRFSRICGYLINKVQIDWHEVVMMGGYHDQSHFIKDFLTFMDENPSLYYRQHKELSYYLERKIA